MEKERAVGMEAFHGKRGMVMANAIIIVNPRCQRLTGWAGAGALGVRTLSPKSRLLRARM